MKRKLTILNAALVALIAAVAWHLHVEMLRTHPHENSVPAGGTEQTAMPPYYAAPAVKALVPAEYIDIANKNLFTKDRNPAIVVEQQAPLPRPVMPALPVLWGILHIDAAAPTAIMSGKSDGPQREVRPGESVGEFKLLAINNQKIMLMWNGQSVSKRPEEMRDRTSRELAATAVDPPPVPRLNNPTLTPKTGPGVPMGAGRKACYPGDPTPPGTIVDGFRKVEWETPFAMACAWEPATRR